MKKIHKYFAPVAIILLASLVLTACSFGNPQKGIPPQGGLYGWIYNLLGIPFKNIMLKTAELIKGQNGAGWAIVIITLVVRTILLPLMLIQQKKSITQQQKMARLQPQMSLIQKALRHKPITPAQQMQLSSWQRELYTKNEVSLTGGIGCLPLLIQMPIMIAIYDAVAYSSFLRESSFFGISLSQKSMVLAIIAAIFAVIQSYLSLIGVPAEQKKTMQSMMFMNPILSLFFGLSFSGAIALYWAAGNFFMIFQQLIVTFFITPREKKRVQEEVKDKPVIEVVSQAKIDKLFDQKQAQEDQAQNNTFHEDLRKRNQGKQNRDH